MSNPILEVNQLKQYFNQGRPQEVRAVDGISFTINEGETFGLVGESGCGKSTTGRSIVRLYEPTAGEIIFDGQNVSTIKGRKALARFRQEVQMIYQDPYASLNPRMKVKEIVAEGLKIHQLVDNREELSAKVKELLERVGLDESHGSRYPHEFSGGQRQRIGIARALAVGPRLIVCDEPISALDVSIQAQVVNLLQELQEEQKLTYLFIAHDLSMVKHISDRIGVMYFGKLVEVGSSDDIYTHPLHPYTESLLSAIPLPDPDYEKNRRRINYQREEELTGAEALYEITPGHYVYCQLDDVSDYQAKAQIKVSKITAF